MTSFNTREEWLRAAVDILRPRFVSVDLPLPEKLRVSCGFPAGSARSKGKAIGQCWVRKASESEHAEIFVSPVLAKATRVLDVLLHELIHAGDDCKSGHKGTFKRVAEHFGLEGKMTATVAGDKLNSWLESDIIAVIGEYPHSALCGSPTGTSSPKKQSTRLLKAACVDCGYTVRVTKKWVEEAGAPLCPCNSEAMEVAS